MNLRPMRAASLTAASALTAASFTVLLAPTAQAVAPPAGNTAVAGTATANGTPIAGIGVTIYDVEADGTSDYLGETTTAADGTYFFDFTTNTTNDGEYVDSSDTAQVKVYFDDARTLTGDQLGLKYEWYADQPTFKRAASLPSPAAGAVTTVPTVSLSTQTGIKGTISVPAPAGYYYYGYVEAYDSDDNYVGDAAFNSDPSDDATNPNGQLTYLLRYLDPAKEYKLYAYASASPISGVGQTINYIGHFIGGNQRYDSATVFTTGASGSILQPVNDSLTDVLVASTAPSIVGQAAPGKTLSIDPGTWNLNADNDYTTQWFVNDALVVTAPTYTVTKADLKKKIRAVVTARNFDRVGTASTDTVKVGYVSKLKTKAKKAVVKGKTVVQVVGKVKVKGVKGKKKAKALKGKITVYEGDVKVGKGKVMKGGKILVTLKGITAGKHEFTVEFAGKKAADATSIEKVKV